jgi:hypothetical protein
MDSLKICPLSPLHLRFHRLCLNVVKKNKVKITQKTIISTNHIFQKKTRSKSPKNQMPRNIFHAVPRWHLCWLIWRRRDGIPAKMQSFSFEPQRNGSRKLMLKLMN